MIVVQNLTKQYGRATILNNVSFDIQAGEAVALWGTNGAGKTTTLRCLLGVLPFEGDITVNGIHVSKQGKAARSLIGYVPQEVAFYDMSVLETLRFYARLKKVRKAEFQALLQQVGLADHAHKSVKALSGGMKQRLALAIGLLSDPPILMLDEPTANLDTQVRDEFLTLIRELNKAGKTVIFSTHRIEEVEYLADRVLVLDQGQITIDCPASEIAGRLGAKQWMQIRVPDAQRELAMNLLGDHGYPALLNTRTFYVPLNTQRRMEPLKLLASADIDVEDFDLTDTVKDAH